MKDYYKILEIKPNASDAEIKSAFRNIAKQSHPDCGEGSCAAKFREAREAYEILSDPEQRRTYDHDRKRSRNKTNRSNYRDIQPHNQFHHHDSLYDMMRLFDNFFFGMSSRRRYPDEFETIRDPHYDVEVELTREETRSATSLPLTLKYKRTCPRCGGSGSNLLYHCPACCGLGSVMAQKIIHLNIPAGISDSTVIEYWIDANGTDKHIVRVLFTIVD